MSEPVYENPLEAPMIEGPEPPERPDYEVAKELLTARLKELGVHVACEFRKEEELKGGFARHHWDCKVMTGVAFLPREKEVYGRGAYRTMLVDEPEGGKVLLECPYFCGTHHKVNEPVWKKRRVRPTTCDVMSCLLSDASAIDHGDYESWAADLGYEKDSRNGEKIYRTCLSIGLKLRSALGDAVLTELRELANRL